MPTINYVLLGAPDGRILSCIATSENEKIASICKKIQAENNLEKDYRLQMYRGMVDLNDDFELTLPDSALKAMCYGGSLLGNLSPYRSANLGLGMSVEKTERLVEVIVVATRIEPVGLPISEPKARKVDTPTVTENKQVEAPKSARLLGLSILHDMLWNKEDTVSQRVFQTLEYPDYDLNGVEIKGVTFTCKALMLADLLSEYFGEKGKPHGFYDDSILPSRAHSLVVRQAYEDLDPILKSLEAGRVTWPDKPPGILVTGNPGIGKTHYLSYILVKCLLQGRRVLYQDEDDAFYLFSNDGVFAYSVGQIKTFAHENDIWALFDMKPPRFIVRTRWLVIHVSSPLVDNYKYWVKQRAGVMYFVSTWTWQEVQAAVRLKIPGLDAASPVMGMMGTLYERYGPIPRLLLNELRNLTSWGFNFKETLEEQEAKLTVKVNQYLRSYSTMGPEELVGMNGSHAVIIIVPVRLGVKVNVGRTCFTTLASKHIAVELALASRRAFTRCSQKIYHDLLNIPQTRLAEPACIDFYEGLVHARLSEGGFGDAEGEEVLHAINIAGGRQVDGRPARLPLHLGRSGKFHIASTIADLGSLVTAIRDNMRLPEVQKQSGIMVTYPYAALKSGQYQRYIRLLRNSDSTIDGICLTTKSHLIGAYGHQTQRMSVELLLFQFYRPGGDNTVRAAGISSLLQLQTLARFTDASLATMSVRLVWILRDRNTPETEPKVEGEFEEIYEKLGTQYTLSVGWKTLLA